MEQRQSSGEHALTERKIRTVVAAICFFIIVIVVLYFVNFNNKFSHLNADWGTLGDYFGGLLNPVIAGAALYFLIESYKLQKRELKETRKLLNESAETQQKQLSLAAQTALLNTNLTKISILQSDIEKISKEFEFSTKELEDFELPTDPNEDVFNSSVDSTSGDYRYLYKKRIKKNFLSIEELKRKNNDIEEQIGRLL